MSDGRVLISTHDLPRAGALRAGFGKAGYATELVTASERLSPDSDAVLLVLTGAVEEDGDELARQAREDLQVPVFGFSAKDVGPPSVKPGYQEVFPHSASLDDVVLLGRRLIERRRLQRLTGIIGETDAVHQVLERVVQIAPVASTVLITGESGTGKELVARGIHALSPRRHKPFIPVNVAALSETLLESELFGHEKGAFTGAIDARRGLFELSDGGTIFLDEIGEMPLATQTKLLRVLEQREFLRVGGERPIRVDVRIVAATNQDLRQLVAIGEFRRDLFFRLNVLAIELPPLRERRADIPLLVRAFVEDVSERHERTFPGISAEAMEILTSYGWPGNVRELRNLVESMVVLAPGGVIRPEDIPDEVRGLKGTSLLPVPLPRAAGGDQEAGRSLRPELEFVFRTLVELRVDMDELRREFEAYRTEAQLGLAPGAYVGRLGGGAAGGGIEIGAYTPASERAAREGGAVGLERSAEPGGEAPGEFGAPGPPRERDGGAGELLEPSEPEDTRTVVYRPGMTIEEMERRAIAAALEEVSGNRRKAAELLGIGERTLYRKIAKYEMEA